MRKIHHAIVIRADSVKDYKFVDFDDGSELLDIHIPKFGIDDARELVKIAHQTPVNASELVLVLRTDFITHESQNALLKLLEEPPESSRLVLVLPPDLILLSTLTSRVSCQLSDVNSQKQNDTFVNFFKMGYGERISVIDQELKSKNIEWQREIKSGLIQYLSSESKNVSLSPELEFITRTLLTRGASNKMLLEHLALTLPARSLS